MIKNMKQKQIQKTATLSCLPVETFALPPIFGEYEYLPGGIFPYAHNKDTLKAAWEFWGGNQVQDDLPPLDVCIKNTQQYLSSIRKTEYE